MSGSFPCAPDDPPGDVFLLWPGRGAFGPVTRRGGEVRVPEFFPTYQFPWSRDDYVAVPSTFGRAHTVKCWDQVVLTSNCIVPEPGVVTYQIFLAHEELTGRTVGTRFKVLNAMGKVVAEMREAWRDSELSAFEKLWSEAPTSSKGGSMTLNNQAQVLFAQTENLGPHWRALILFFAHEDMGGMNMV